jgi:hypothetical protein
MLYLRNTNQLQSIEGGRVRGNAPAPTPSASILYDFSEAGANGRLIILENGISKVDVTSSFNNSIQVASGSIVSASLSGIAWPTTGSTSMSLFITGANVFYNQSSSVSSSTLMTSFTASANLTYYISASVNHTSASSLSNAGLVRIRYNGYFGGDPTWFATGEEASGPEIDTGVIQTGWTSSVDEKSTQWRGYFSPATTEDYRFRVQSDDSCMVWLGSDAINNFTTSSYIVGSPGLGPFDVTSGPQSLVAGQFYPMRIQWGERFVGEFLSMSFYTSTITETDNFTGRLFYNTTGSPYLP